MFAGFMNSAVVDTLRAFRASPMATPRAVGTSPRLYACSGEVDIGSAQTLRAVDSVADAHPKAATRRAAVRDVRTAGTLTGVLWGDEFSGSVTKTVVQRERSETAERLVRYESQPRSEAVHEAVSEKTLRRRLLTHADSQKTRPPLSVASSVERIVKA
jgi:hypothetical protein